jgi:hypothetical protein
MMQKIHSGKGKRDEKYKLEGYVELDEGYYYIAS